MLGVPVTEGVWNTQYLGLVSLLSLGLLSTVGKTFKLHFIFIIFEVGR